MAKSWLLWLVMVSCSMAASSQIIADDVPAPNKSTNASSRFDNDKPSFILLNVGMAAPVGAYGSNSIFDEDAGYAITGFHLSVNYGYTFSRFLGLTATGGFITQNIGLDEIVDVINRYSINNITISDYEYAGMRFAYATGGLMITVPATQKFSIDLKLQGGLVYGVDNGLSWEIQDSTGVYVEKFGKASGGAFLPDIGLNFRLLVTDHFTMNFFTDFVMANFQFKDVTVYRNDIPVGMYDYPLRMRSH